MMNILYWKIFTFGDGVRQIGFFSCKCAHLVITCHIYVNQFSR